MHIGSKVIHSDGSVGTIVERAAIYNCWTIRWWAGVRAGTEGIASEDVLTLSDDC